MYPLKMSITHGEATGHAVANDAGEHRSLSDAGYVPAIGASVSHTVETARKALDAQGVAYDGRWGLSKLLTLLQ